MSTNYNSKVLVVACSITAASMTDFSNALTKISLCSAYKVVKRMDRFKKAKQLAASEPYYRRYEKRKRVR